MQQRTNETSTPPVITDLVSTALIEDHLKITYADEADYITQLGNSVIATLQKDLNESYGAGTIIVEQDRLPANFTIPVRSERVSAVSIAYVDKDGVTQTLSENDFAISAAGYPTLISMNPETSFELRDWGLPVSVSITTTAGTMSPAIEMAALLLLAHWYENREAVGAKTYPTPLAYERLIANERIPAQRAANYFIR